MNFPVFDLHCDTANELIGHGGVERSSMRKNNVHIDLERARTFDGYAQCFACFTTTGKNNPVDIFEKKLAAIFSEVERNSDLIRVVYSVDDIVENRSQGLMSAILTIEGPAGFGFDPALLEDLHKVGFLMSSLGWNEKNPLTGSHITGGGLSDQGRVYVKELQRLGMIVDVSHISDEGFWDIMNITEGPVVATHSNSRSICNVSRNLTDDMFCAICSTGGLAGINLYADFVGDHPTVDTVCDHIFHFLELDPDGTHIGLGGDLDGCDTLPEGIQGIQDYCKLSDRLLQRGLTENMVHNIFWNNAFEVMKHALHNHTR